MRFNIGQSERLPTWLKTCWEKEKGWVGFRNWVNGFKSCQKQEGVAPGGNPKGALWAQGSSNKPMTAWSKARLNLWQLQGTEGTFVSKSAHRSLSPSFTQSKSIGAGWQQMPPWWCCRMTPIEALNRLPTFPPSEKKVFPNAIQWEVFY